MIRVGSDKLANCCTIADCYLTWSSPYLSVLRLRLLSVLEREVVLARKIVISFPD